MLSVSECGQGGRRAVQELLRGWEHSGLCGEAGSLWFWELGQASPCWLTLGTSLLPSNLFSSMKWAL